MKIFRSFLLATGALLLMTGIAYADGVRTAETSTALTPAAIDASRLPQQPPGEPNSVTMAPMALNSLTNPPAKIATARVADQSGTVVGTVQKVELDASGKPLKLDIALMGSDRIVAVDSARLSYDLSNNVVTAALDKQQLAQLPPVPQG